MIFAFWSYSLISSHGRDYSGRGPWEMTALCGLIAASTLTFLCIRIGFRRGPAFGIVDDRIEHFGWRDSVPVTEVVGVRIEPGNFWLRRGDRLFLTLRDGSQRNVPTFLLQGHAGEIATAIREALGLDREPLPLS